MYIMNYFTAVRLVNGSDCTEGRLEVKVNGTWGTVSAYSTGYFTSVAAGVVCNQLGFRYV